MRTTDLLLSIPAYNEAAIIAESLRRITGELVKTIYAWDVVVVDNGSSDGTSRIVESLGLAGVDVVSTKMRGKGAAIWTGGNLARERQAHAFGFIDADLSADPKHIDEFHTLLTRGDADIIIGSRLLNKGRVQRGALRTLSSELFNAIRHLILGIPVRDTQCGLKLMNAKGLSILAECRERTWFLDIEFLARAHRAGLRIKEVPVDWDEFRFPDRASKLSLMRDGIAAGIAMLRIRFLMLQS